MRSRGCVDLRRRHRPSANRISIHSWLVWAEQRSQIASRREDSAAAGPRDILCQCSIHDGSHPLQDEIE